jgi:hypothetical protein
MVWCCFSTYNVRPSIVELGPCAILLKTNVYVHEFSRRANVLVGGSWMLDTVLFMKTLKNSIINKIQFVFGMLGLILGLGFFFPQVLVFISFLI